MRETPPRKRVRELFVRDLVPAPGAVCPPPGDSQVTSLMVGEEKDDGGSQR